MAAMARGKQRSINDPGRSNQVASLEIRLLPVFFLGRRRGSVIKEKIKRSNRYHKCIPTKAKFPPKPYKPSK